MVLIRRTIALLVVVVCCHGLQARAAPKLVSIFPLGGQRGTAIEVEVRGSGLEGTYAVWLGPGSRLDAAKPPGVARPTKGPDGIAAHVLAIPDGARAKLRLAIAADARVGFHNLAVISPTGLSGNIPFWVGPNPVIQEAATLHKTADSAQAVTLPVAINGHTSESGQRAYYAFEVGRDTTVAFDVIALHGTGFDPQLALYETGGSYLDPKRSKRLLFHEEITQGGMPANRHMTYHFTKPGRYLVSLANIFTQGGGDFSYLLRIAADDRPTGEDALAWADRRLREIQARAVGTLVEKVGLVKEAEPNEQPAQAKMFAIPAVLEGAIGRPGDVDCFRFQARAGQKLAMEVQTPNVGAPHFNLRLDVLNASGVVVHSNLRVQDGKIGTVDTKVLQVSSDLLGTLAADGEYTLRVRDVTSTQGSADHVYRILVRSQVPHLGDVKVQPAGPVNLPLGGRQRLTLSAPGTEGFAGTLALSTEGLPEGVRAFVGTNGTTIDLIADSHAPVSSMPQLLRIGGLPVVGEKTGSAFPVAEIPIMVIKK